MAGEDVPNIRRCLPRPVHLSVFGLRRSTNPHRRRPNSFAPALPGWPHHLGTVAHLGSSEGWLYWPKSTICRLWLLRRFADNIEACSPHTSRVAPSSASIVAPHLPIMTMTITPTSRSTASQRAQARAIVQEYGNNTLSYFALRETGRYFFNETSSAFLSYRCWSNVALVGADPIGPPDQIKELTHRFLSFCESSKLTPCFLGVSRNNLHAYRELGLRILKIGEECLLPLPDFDVSKLKRKVRRAERHCLNLGITASMYTASDLPQNYRDRALDVSREWIQVNGGSEHGFSMTLGRFPYAEDADVRVVVAARGSSVLGFLTFMPVGNVGGWSLDMMRRLTTAPNGLNEFMLIQSARKLQAEGYQFMSLNFAALSNTEAFVLEPRALTSLRRFCFDYLSWLFQMKSLYRFNAKFQPTWESRYLAFRDLKSIGKIVMAIIQSEDPIELPRISCPKKNSPASRPR